MLKYWSFACKLKGYIANTCTILHCRVKNPCLHTCVHVHFQENVVPQSYTFVNVSHYGYWESDLKKLAWHMMEVMNKPWKWCHGHSTYPWLTFTLYIQELQDYHHVLYKVHDVWLLRNRPTHDQKDMKLSMTSTENANP